MSFQASNHTNRHSTSRVDVQRGCVGRVLTQIDDSSFNPKITHGLPTVQQWLPHLRQLANDPRSMPERMVLKYSRAGEVFRATLPMSSGPLHVVCRQSRSSGWGRELGRLFGATRERQNFHRALNLLACGIRTALPLVLLETRATRIAGLSGFPAPTESWLVTEYVEGLHDLDQALLDLDTSQVEPSARQVKDAMISAVVNLLISFDRHGLTHRDLKASNVLLQSKDKRNPHFEPWLLDLDGLRRAPRSLRARQRQLLMRLTASLVDHIAVSKTDLTRALRRFLIGTGADENPWRRTIRELSQAADSYTKHHPRPKSHKLQGYLNG